MTTNHGVLVNAGELARLLRLELPASDATLEASFSTRRLREGESLYRVGDPFHTLYVIRAGFFKTVLVDANGLEQVLAFPMQSDLMGADGIASGHYASEAVALEDSEVVVVPFSALSSLSRQSPAFERALFALMSRELVREQGMLYVVGILGAEGRVAAFLLNTAERFGALGYSRSSFNLRMTRQEIGSYLGLKLETVSRALSAFDAAGLIKVHLKQVDIVDAAGLRRYVDSHPASSARAAAGPTRVEAPRRSAASAPVAPRSRTREV